MALLFAESFDGWNSISDVWKYRNAKAEYTQCTIDATGGRFGGGALRPTSLQQGIVLPFFASPGANLIRMACWFKCNQAAATTGSRWPIMLTNMAYDRYIRMWMNGAAGASTFNIGRFDDITSGAQVGSPTDIINDNAWHHIEVEYVADGSSGVAKVWIDGVLDTNFSGDTNDAASGNCTNLNAIQLGGANTNSSGQLDIWIDDVIVWDDQGTGFTGELTEEHRLRLVLPNGDGPTSQWTPSSGANYAAVDDATIDADSTYVETSTVGHVDAYTYTPSAIPANIMAVLMRSTAKRTGIKGMNLRHKAVKGMNTSNGAERAAPLVYNTLTTPFEVDPDGNEWNWSRLSGTSFRQEYSS